MFDLQLEWTVGVGGGGKGFPHPYRPLYFWPWTAPLVQIYFSPQPFAVIRTKDGGYNFRYEITEHSLAKSTPALQATQTIAPFSHLYQYQ